MLSNAYFLAKFRFDAAENEPTKKLQMFAKQRNGTSLASSRASAPSPSAGSSWSRSRAVDPGDKADQPCVLFETARSTLEKFAFCFAKFANFWRARSRLHQKVRLTAFFKLYKICILLHRCNLKIFAKIGLKNQQFS